LEVSSLGERVRGAALGNPAFSSAVAVRCLSSHLPSGSWIGTHGRQGLVCNVGDTATPKPPPRVKGEPMSRPVELPQPSSQPSLEVNHVDGGAGVCVVTPAGEIDLASAPQLKSRLVGLLEEGFARFVLDLSAVRYLDSTGLGVLIAFSRRLGADGEIVLAEAPEPVLSLLELTGLDAQFPPCASVEEALGKIRGSVGDAAQPTLCPDAEIVLGLAAAALPFAESTADELRRWVRILSDHGEAGRALRCVGLTDTRIEGPAATSDPGAGGPAAHGRAVLRVEALAAAIATDREAATISTVDLLLAVMAAYGDAFDHELHAHGTSSVELIECLASAPA
jgi:anti-sigma B factor antagonist